MIERARFTSYLADLEAKLGLMHQLVSGVLAMEQDGGELAPILAIAETLARQQPDLKELPAALSQAYRSVSSALGDLRVSRETIRAHALDRLQRTHDRLAEVTSTTESATSLLLDGLERAQGMIDRLERASLGGTDGSASDVRVVAQELRQEVNSLFQILQFQDITSQQLGAAGELLAGVEQRLQSVASLFESDAAGQPERPGAAGALPVFDAAASTRNGEARQELADTILAEMSRTPATLHAAPVV